MTVAPTGLDVTPVDLRRPGPRALERRLRATVAAFGPRLAPLVVRRGIGREVPDAELARQVRRAFQRLGATYVKLGQVVASAPSVFGPEVSEEFRRLLDAGRPVRFDRVQHTIEAELGRPLGDVFASFDPDPIGRASIAVVHRATTRAGREVAVKVTRPGVRRKVAADLEIMRRLLPRLAGRIAGGDASLVGPIVDGLGQQLAEELDLRNEARTMMHFRGLLGEVDLPGIVIPEVVEAHERVLVMELLDGVPIDDLAGVADFAVDPAPIVQQVVKAWFLTTVRDGVFHGDVHAGNLLFLRDGRIGVLDWGILGRLAPDTHDHLRSIIAAALGDESAWLRVTDRIAAQLGPLIEARLGIGPEQIPALVRGVIEPLLTRPFGDVQLSTLFLGPDGLDGAGADRDAGGVPGVGFLRRRRDGAAGVAVEFDRGMFLLAKQLLYFERYGKLYLSDVSLVSDRDFFEALIA
jgi:predicted unusual protein kinase regulating ubiquinone biosynthesis (AarF/ABC1/UbiB family)